MFLVVVEEEYFGCVVEWFGMIQLLLFEYIKVFEIILGVILFDWFRRGIKFMVVGLVFLLVVCRFVDQVVDLECMVKEVVIGQLGIFNVGVIMLVMIDIILQWMYCLNQEILDLIVLIYEIDSVEVVLGLCSGVLDLVFYWLDGSFGEGFEGFLVIYDKLWVVLFVEYFLVNEV